MPVDIEDLFEQLATYGTAPVEGCGLFGVGYEQPFEALKAHYLIRAFGKGSSAEKFVVGPFGSGKTHFLRQLMEIARTEDCVTIEVPLNKNIEFTKTHVVYKEMTRVLRTPGVAQAGVGGMVREAVARIRATAERSGFPPDVVLDGWIRGIGEAGLALPGFARVAQLAAAAAVSGEEEAFNAAIAWLSGEFSDKGVCARVGEVPCSSDELKVRTHNARLSLYQFVRHARFRGTVVGFDEAEQGMAVDKKRMGKIFSQLLSELNALVDLKDGSVLVVYAITPDVMEKITNDMPMLAQRLGDPGRGNGFLDGNVRAARVDLTRDPDMAENLVSIGTSLCRLFFAQHPDADAGKEPEAGGAIPEVVKETMQTEAGSSARRELVKRVSVALLSSYTKVPGTYQPAKPEMEPEA